MTILKERLLYLETLGFVILVGIVLGSVTGGGFSDNVNWRWIGWINLRLLGIALALALPFMRLKSTNQYFELK